MESGIDKLGIGSVRQSETPDVAQAGGDIRRDAPDPRLDDVRDLLAVPRADQNEWLSSRKSGRLFVPPDAFVSI